MSPAAALLRRLGAEGAAKGWLRAGSYVYVHHKLLPLLAGLVEAVAAFTDPKQEDDVDANYQRVERALAALEAAAAKEVPHGQQG